MKLIQKLPKVDGELLENVPLKERVFFGVGGNAEVLFIPHDNDDLSLFLREIDKSIPLTILGSGSNVLIRDGGIPGVVIKLGRNFENHYVENDVIEVGAAVPVSKIATLATDVSLSGFEFLVGIPGSVGGAIKMNAGCYGSSFGDIFIEAEGIRLNGDNVWLTKDKVNFDYRKSSIGDDLIVTRIWLKGIKSNSYQISKDTHDIFIKKKKSQPLNCRSCGSTFKNPENCDKKAWQLIDEAGCRGLTVGGAKVSDVHCNFIVNTGEATAKDIETLGEEIIKRVFENSGVKLEWEIVKLGKE